MRAFPSTILRKTIIVEATGGGGGRVQRQKGGKGITLGEREEQ